MAELSTVAAIIAQFYRLVGTESDDAELTAHGESADQVAYECLTEGTRMAQLVMLGMGWNGWRKLSSALSFSTATDDTQYADVPSDFLRAYGSDRPGYSALVKPNGDRWGTELDDEDQFVKGDGYYLKDDEGTERIFLTRLASPPNGLLLDYHYEHPVWTSSVTIDFPLRMRGIIAPAAAVVGMDQNWLPGGRDLEFKIQRAYERAEERVRNYVRATKSPRRMRKPTRFASRY